MSIPEILISQRLLVIKKFIYKERETTCVCKSLIPLLKEEIISQIVNKTHQLNISRHKYVQRNCCPCDASEMGHRAVLIQITSITQIHRSQNKKKILGAVFACKNLNNIVKDRENIPVGSAHKSLGSAF